MKIHKFIWMAAVPLLCVSAHAQDCCKSPKKGDITVAVTVGYNSYTDLKAQPGNLTDYQLEAVSASWNDKKLMVGIEGGWFFSDLWKLTLGGGLSFHTNPGYSSVPGTVDGDSEPGDGSIPNYGSVAEQDGLQLNVFTGVDRYFKTNINGLMPYVGVRMGYAYGRNTSKWDDDTMMGQSVGESFNVRGSATIGVDYFLSRGFYVGAQVDPFSYTYNKSTLRPQEGLANLEANSHHIGVLAAPTLKVGFKF